jgi:predicted amino acid-binding ACT domain protein
MATTIRRVQYFYATVPDQPGEAYGLLSQLAQLGVNLLAISAIPMGPMTTQLQIFPDDPPRLSSAAKHAGMTLSEPQPALLVQGDDEMGALSGVHARLAEASVNIYASNGVSDGRGHFGYIMYLRAEDYERGARALGV